MVRTLDSDVDDATAAAALALLTERGFARMTIAAVAKHAGVGKPAIYRRFTDKAGLVAHVISCQLPVLERPISATPAPNYGARWRRACPPMSHPMSE
jgi:AcrR family transcriptional regulator